MRKLLAILMLILSPLLSACSADVPSSNGGTVTTAASPKTEEAKGFSGATVITLADQSTSVQGNGVQVSGDVVTVTKAGAYVVRGTLSNGQLRVDCAEKGTVELMLDGVSVHSDTTAPLFVRKSDKTVLTLAKDSNNTFSDGAAFVYEDTEKQEPSGAVFSKSDLTINGEGSLSVTAVFADGIVSRDGLELGGGTVSVQAADDAVMGRDYVRISGGDITLNAAGDGLKSTNDNDDAVGYVSVENGKLTVTSGKDGIQAKSALTVSGGDIRITAGGGSQNGTANEQYDFGWGADSVDSSPDGKGLKAGTALTVSGGKVEIDAADDAVHSNQTIVISGGEITVASGDDGVHADTSLTVQNGVLNVTKSYEGLEAATITVDGGDISLTASDDGVNASSGNSDTSGDRGMHQNPFASDDSAFYINGGCITVNAMGDGLDSNGMIKMTGGEVYVIGPSNGGNGTFDYGASFDITGGKLVAIGSSGMATAPTSNTMNSILWNGFAMTNGDKLTVTATDGAVIAQMEALRNAAWLYVTCDELTTGDDVAVTCGATSKTFTIEEGGNTEGSMGGMHGGPVMGGGMGRPDMGGGPPRP